MVLEVAVNTNSLRLVEEELNKTLAGATAKFESFLSERHNLGLLDQAEQGVKQVAGTLDLLQIPGAALIAREMHLLLHAILADNSEDVDDKQLSLLSTAFFMLPRYLEFVANRQVDIPVMAVSHANELRVARGVEMLREVDFSGETMPSFSMTAKLSVPTPGTSAEEFKEILKRLRHMYQVGLLGILRDAEPELHLRLMGRAVQRLAAQLPPGPVQRFWLLAHVVLECFQQQGLELNITRKRLLSQLDKEIRTVAARAPDIPREIPAAVEKELLYLLMISSYREGLVARFLENTGIEALQPPDHALSALKREMLGPGFETLTSVVNELRSELRNAKDMLEILMQSGNTDEEELRPLVGTLEQVADVLRVLNLTSLAELLEQLAQSLHTLREQGKYDSQSVFSDVADALLFVESSLDQLDRHKLSQSDLAEITGERRKEITSGNLLVDATNIALKESQSGINLAKRAISSYVESGYDITHISNVARTLDGIRGACQLLGKKRVTQVLLASVRFIDDYVKNKDRNDQDKQQLLETLADALISLEYYLSELATRHTADENTLKIAEESLASLGYAVEPA